MIATMECRRCETEVPAGNYCGLCGCNPAEEPDFSPVWLRPKTFGAAPAERVLSPYLVSSLFPQLPTRSRTVFRWAIAIAVVALLISAIMRLPSTGIALGAFGLPLLFGLYLRASGADRDVPRSALVVAVVLGGLLGMAWVMVTGHVVSSRYGVPLSVGLALHHLLREGLIAPVVGMLLMIVPTVLIRFVWRSSRESLDGFMIGVLAALAFSAAATLSRLAPQVAAGLIAHARPMKGLVVQAVLCGITVPISAAAAGGMVGIALWFRPPGRHQSKVRLTLALLAVAVLLIHAAVGVIDIIGMPQIPMAIMHLVITVVVLLGLRLSLQLAMLHEANDPVEPDQPLLCPNCEMVVPDMSFCPACGVATRASSQLSRRQRRALRPQSATGERAGEQAGERVYPGYSLAADSYAAPPVHRPRFAWLLSRWGVGVVSVAALLAGAALVFTPKIAHYMCPPDCGRPPTGTPVMALPRYEAPDGAFSVAYPAPGTAYTIDTGNGRVTATYTGGDGGVMQLFSEPANRRSARDIAAEVVKRTYPDSKVAYEIPNAMVGYQPGYGEVADYWPQGSSARIRIVSLVAVKNDVALVAFATGPYHAFGPDYGPGPPSGANLEIAQDMGKYVNSFQWRGDPPR